MTERAEPPVDEAERLAALRRYAILDTAPEENFDRIARLAARQFGVPIALVSLIDEDRQWFKASCGLDVREMGRDVAFCAHAILGDDVFVVPDATKDPRFSDNPLVTEDPEIRFYAGAPLTDRRGHKLGTLCLIDTEPRPGLSSEDQALLRDLAAVVTDQIEMRHATGDVLGEVEARIETEENLAQTKSLQRETQLRYEAIFNHTFQFCGILDLDGIVLEVNDTALEFGGLSRDEVVGMPFAETYWWRVGTATRDAVEEAVRKASAGEFVRFDVEVQGEGGVRVPIDFTLKPITDDSGTVTMLIAEGRDISEQIETEKALRRNQEELELIFNSVPMRIFFKDDKNRIIRLNKAAAQSMDMPVEDVEGADTYELFPEQAKKYHDDDLEVINSGRPKLGIVEEYTPREGERGWVRTDKVPYVDPDTGDRFVFAAATDITAEKQAEEAWRAGEARYRSLYNNTPIMLHSVDIDGRLVSVSDFWLKKLGYERDEVLGRKSTEFLTAESAKKAKYALDEFYRTGTCADVEYQFVTKSGDIRDVLLSAVAERDGNGAIVRSMAVSVDITDRKIIENQLLQSQKMETVGQLTAGLAHDINNMLGVIVGNLELLEREADTDDKAAKRIGAALGAVDRGAELTQRLLAFSRRQDLETTSIEPNPLIENLAGLLKRTLGENIELECRLGENMPTIHTDPSQLESAILNLAVNARDAMPNGGKLTIGSGLVHLDTEYAAREVDLEPGDYVVLAVTDTGVGIPADEIEKVFEPFFTTKDLGSGTGLGLSMVYGLVKQSGGHVRIYSEVGHGTSVKLYLPIETAAQKDEASPVDDIIASDEEVGGWETILVVEDQSDVRKVAIGLLEYLGYKIVSAENAQEALERLESSEEIDLLFTDIMMPGGMDGKDLARFAREMRPGLPVVFATGYAESAILREGEIKTSANLVTKPYRRADLAAKIRHALDTQAGAQPSNEAAA
ncbi:PAS domain S-box protein [Parasphingopyxis algicola]|uniref:PAS domain S-box protein n=1 Tax=Parasphingopyxis algicola TaxID=2026624 RepID=UPI0015A0D6B5|nr:PAS domain S-box protein [Parasphingopyxis algicola]QLC24949.1 PAS domain S-box protein [Parasphingopyxis algicola]